MTEPSFSDLELDEFEEVVSKPSPSQTTLVGDSALKRPEPSIGNNTNNSVSDISLA